jgi:CTP:molybdopterin cytidylyltransferase MocA
MNNFGVDTSFEAIILAGGLGTRLASVTGGAPKVLADVGGRPFLSYLLDDLVTSGAARVILAVGHRSEEVISQFGSSYRTLPLSYVVERQLLGTGGAILNAMSALSGIDALVLNGDTWVRVDQRAMMIAHRKWPSELTMAIAPVQDVARLNFPVVRSPHFLKKASQGPGSSTRDFMLCRAKYLAPENLAMPSLLSATFWNRACFPAKAFLRFKQKQASLILAFQRIMRVLNI